MIKTISCLSCVLVCCLGQPMRAPGMKNSLEQSIMKMDDKDIVRMNGDSAQFAESCRLLVRDSDDDELKEKIVCALWRELFE